MDVQPMTPISEIYILRGVTCEEGENTYYFANANAQYSYFVGKMKYHFTGLTPIRENNVIRIPTNADNLTDCNYVMYKNANILNKWFYGFIKRVDYINVNRCNITVKIDTVQTFLTDMILGDCLIERETVDNDTIGRHLIPENLDTGEYLLSYINPQFQQQINQSMTQMSILIFTTFDENFANVDGALWQNIYSGLNVLIFNTSDAGIAACNAFLKSATENSKMDGIVGIVMLPTAFCDPRLHKDMPAFYDIAAGTKKYSDIDGYVPRNKKLFTYPYNFMYVTDYSGNHAEYRYEFWNDPTNPNSTPIRLIGNLSYNPGVAFVPTNYKYRGEGATIVPNFNEKMMITGYPQCAYTIDSFRAYLAQLGTTGIPNMIGTAATATIGAMALGPAGVPTAMLGIAAQAVSLLAQGYAASKMPPQAKGGNSSNFNVSANLKTFGCYNMHITSEFAKTIDGFFTQFGYLTKRTGKPNLTSRSRFNYVKTINSCINGNIPNIAKIEIQDRFNAGIRFWHDLNNVGNYTAANNIL